MKLFNFISTKLEETLKKINPNHQQEYNKNTCWFYFKVVNVMFTYKQVLEEKDTDLS